LATAQAMGREGGEEKEGWLRGMRCLYCNAFVSL
jgi:hypothetical protein